MSTARAMEPGSRREPAEALAEARRQSQIVSPGRAEMPNPFPHPFDSWPLPLPDRTFQPEEKVWTAAMNREDHWEVGLMFVAGRSGTAVALDSVWPRLAPASFVHPAEPRVAMEQRTPVMIARREGVSYGRFARTAWDRLIIGILRDGKEYYHGADFDAVRALRPGEWELGSPAAYRSRTGWRPLQIVQRHGDTILGLEGEALRALPIGDVRLIEIGEVFPPGTPVLALPLAGFEPPTFEPAVVVEVLADGAAYVITDDHGERVLSFEQVMLREPDQARVPAAEAATVPGWDQAPAAPI